MVTETELLAVLDTTSFDPCDGEQACERAHRFAHIA